MLIANQIHEPVNFTKQRYDLHMTKFKPVFDVRPGQIREFHTKENGLVLVYGTEGFRADVIYSTGRRDSVFSGWLSEVSNVVSEVCEHHVS